MKQKYKVEYPVAHACFPFISKLTKFLILYFLFSRTLRAARHVVNFVGRDELGLRTSRQLRLRIVALLRHNFVSVLEAFVANIDCEIVVNTNQGNVGKSDKLKEVRTLIKELNENLKLTKTR